MQLSGIERGKEVCGRSTGQKKGLESWCWLVETEKSSQRKEGSKQILLEL